MDHRSRSLLAAGLLLAGVLGLVTATPFALAADWAERAFAPPIPSRWVIQSEETEKDEANNTVTGTSTKKITALLVFEEKLADGYRISYRRTDGSYEGNADDPATARAALAAMQGHTYRVVTDRTGKPLRVENLDELRAAMRKTIDEVAAHAANAEVAAGVRQLMAGFADVDPERAAEHLDELPLLARGQNTGLTRNEVRRQTSEESVPGATPMRQTITLRIVDAAPDGATARLELIEVQDPDSLRAMMLSLLGKLDAADPGVREQIEAVKKMQISQEIRAELDVVDGMTRRVQLDRVTSKSLLGESTRITDRNIVTVAPAP